MTFAFTLFGVSLVGAAAMLGFQFYRLRSGKVEISRTMLETPREHISVAKVKRTIWQTARAVFHIVIMQLIKVWAVITHFVQKKWQQWFGYKTNASENGTQKESFFLHSVSEYKHRLKRIKEKLKEKDGTQA